jgi:rare lipoprotein A
MDLSGHQCKKSRRERMRIHDGLPELRHTAMGRPIIHAAMLARTSVAIPCNAAWIGAAALLLAGCASTSVDGPGANPPPGLDRVPDAVPRIEPLRAGGANKPYRVAGRSYTPMTGDGPFSETGLASWYGRKFHGRPTASGEPYDMYAMSAAHPTLPIPSYVRVRNPANGREVVLRINDRGPFVDGRIIDLSYTAALKLGVLAAVAKVEVRRITFADMRASELLGSALP